MPGRAPLQQQHCNVRYNRNSNQLWFCYWQYSVCKMDLLLYKYVVFLSPRKHHLSSVVYLINPISVTMSKCLADVVYLKTNEFHRASPEWCGRAVGCVIFPRNGGKYVKICNISDPCFHELSFHEICVSSDITSWEDGPISHEILAGWKRDLAYGTHHSFLYTVVYFSARGNITNFTST